MPGFYWKRHLAALVCAVIAMPAFSAQAPPNSSLAAFLPRGETLTYGVEWRLIRAGTAKLSWNAAAGDSRQVNLELRSAGMVNTLYRVSDSYVATLARDW